MQKKVLLEKIFGVTLRLQCSGGGGLIRQKQCKGASSMKTKASRFVTRSSCFSRIGKMMQNLYLKEQREAEPQGPLIKYKMKISIQKQEKSTK